MNNPDNLFFRGANRMDWLFAIMLQNAVDWDAPSDVEAVASQLGFVSQRRFEFASLAPAVSVVVTDDFVFVVSASTHNVYQWVGNILGSVATPFLLGNGSVASYFQTVATLQYLAVRATVLSNITNRQLVLTGFSLGGASVTLLKEIFHVRDNLDSSCIVFASPRVGLSDFVASYPSDNFSRMQYQHDPVPGLPPQPWCGLGTHVGWIPLGTLVNYQHIQPGYTGFLPYDIRSGDSIPDSSETILGFNLDLFRQVHTQLWYAKIIRGGITSPIEDGFQGYPKASEIDTIASPLFSGGQWPFNVLHRSDDMASSNLVQLAIQIVSQSAPKGYWEIYYFNATDPAPLFNAVVAGGASGVLADRLAFLAGNCAIAAVRVSAVAPSAKQSNLKKFQPQLSGAQGGTGSSDEELDNCLTFFLYSSDRKGRRQIHFRGIPRNWITGDLRTPAGLTAEPLFFTWLATLRGLGTLVIKNANYSAQSTFGSITQAALGANVSLNLDTALNVPANSLVNISKVRGFPLLRGNWLTAGTGGISAAALPILATKQFAVPTTTGGLVRIYDLTTGSGGYYIVSVMDFNGASVRKTGRISFLPRGRRSAQVRHR